MNIFKVDIESEFHNRMMNTPRSRGKPPIQVHNSQRLRSMTKNDQYLVESQQYCLVKTRQPVTSVSLTPRVTSSPPRQVYRYLAHIQALHVPVSHARYLTIGKVVALSEGVRGDAVALFSPVESSTRIR